MHGKDVALLHIEPGRVRLSPDYDVVPTVLWPALRTEAAMSIGGRRDLTAVTLDDVLAEAARWPLPRECARTVVARTVQALRDAAATTAHDELRASVARRAATSEDVA